MFTTAFVIIFSIILILALLLNYITKDAIIEEEDSPYIAPLENDFKPIISDLYNEDDESTPVPPPTNSAHFPPNPSQAYIESYYQSLTEKEHPEKAEVNRQIHTVNPYVDAHYELNLSMFGKGPTIEMIDEAYEKLLNEHVNSIARGVNPSFDINIKKRAKEYLIAHHDALNR